MKTEQQAIDPKVVDRIRKMLNLSRDGGATEGEAAAAMEAAQKTMRKYNLTMAEVEAGGGASDSKRTKAEQKGRAQYAFQQELMKTCAEVNFCIALMNIDYAGGRQRVAGFTLIGREANVIATRELFDYLMTTTERLAFEYVGSDNTKRLSNTAVSFKIGCATRLEDRLRERHAAAMEAQAREAREKNAAARHPGSSGGSALAIVLTDFAQDEEDRNEDLRWGRPEGYTSQHRKIAQATWEVRQAAAEALLGHTTLDREAMMRTATRAAMALASQRGVDDERVKDQVFYAVSARMEYLQHEAKREAETPAQKAKREEREARESQRYWDRQRRADRRESAKYDHSAIRAGSRAAETVGLDKQVKDAPTPAGRLK